MIESSLHQLPGLLLILRIAVKPVINLLPVFLNLSVFTDLKPSDQELIIMPKNLYSVPHSYELSEASFEENILIRFNIEEGPLFSTEASCSDQVKINCSDGLVIFI